MPEQHWDDIRRGNRRRRRAIHGEQAHLRKLDQRIELRLARWTLRDARVSVDVIKRRKGPNPVSDDWAA
jgi:hypothetical protein